MTMAYDELGRLMKSIGAATQTTTLSYDRTDLQVQVKDPRNNLYGYSYDSLQRLIHTQDQAGGEVTVTRNAQDYGGITVTVHLIRDYGDSAFNSYVCNASFSTNAAGRVTQITNPSGRLVIITRNTNGQVTGVTTKQTAAATAVNVATALTYAPMSNLVKTMTHGNGLLTSASYDLDYRLSLLTLKDGATTVSSLAYAYTDLVNLTGITDGVTAANSNTLGYSLANRLNAASGAWGSNSFTYDGVGNRLSAVTRNTVSYATYGYNALEQLTTRTTTATGGPVGQVAYTYDRDGHLLTEATASSGVKTREYIWLPSNDNSPVDLPLAVIDVASNTISFVHADHLGRPIRMTSPTKTTVWQATWKPWGEVQAISGTSTNNLRFPGQYFQIETGLHYNHHRMYDPVTGRYTQPDPLRFVDRPSIYAYAKNSPFMRVDRDGLSIDRGNSPSSDSGVKSCSGNDNIQLAGWRDMSIRQKCSAILCLILLKAPPQSVVRPKPAESTKPKKFKSKRDFYVCFFIKIRRARMGE